MNYVIMLGLPIPESKTVLPDIVGDDIFTSLPIISGCHDSCAAQLAPLVAATVDISVWLSARMGDTGMLCIWPHRCWAQT